MSEKEVKGYVERHCMEKTVERYNIDFVCIELL